MRDLAVERLEHRLMLTTFIVVSSGDSPDAVLDGVCDDGSGACTLRAAIEEANGVVGADRIEFEIPGPGPHVISPLLPLPPLADPVGGTTIDGRTQTAFGGDDNLFGPEIILDGSLAGPAPGLVISSNGNHVLGLNVRAFAHYGILIDGGRQNSVAGNYIGTDETGMFPLGNGAAGVALFDASANRIGTNGDGDEDMAERNVVSGNAGEGVLILGPESTENTVAGNRIGTDADGTTALGNGSHGVLIVEGAQSNRIGTDGDGIADAAERNVISGNGASGVEIALLGTDFNNVAGNYVGTDANGSVGLGNQGPGISIVAGPLGNRIGTDGDGLADQAEGNLISANRAEGIAIVHADDNRVAGNLIGTDATGMLPLGNGLQGVGLYEGAQWNRIGTDGNGVADPDERNVISGNFENGLFIADPSTGHNTVAGNYIGTDITGAFPLGNRNAGVTIWFAGSNTIGTDGDGGEDSVEGNVISSNEAEGVLILGPESTENTVAGNRIGTDADGTTALGNGSHGVLIVEGAQSNRIGTDGDGIADAAERNVISGNGASGVEIALSGTDFNNVAGNYIGTDANGSVGLGNQGPGISIVAGPLGNRIGTDGDGLADQAEGNLISANRAEGIAIVHSDNNTVAGNRIGTDATGTFPLGNGLQGVGLYEGAQWNRIGTDGDGVGDPDERNVISGNFENGLFIADPSTGYNTVAGNYIGTDVTGTAPLGNQSWGVGIWHSAQRNRVGTDGNGIADASEGNLISGNGLDGVVITFQAAENLVAGNFIGTDVTGTVAVPNGVGAGIPGHRGGIEIANGANRNRIGTNADGVSDEWERNLISGNLGNGITIFDDVLSGSAENVIAGNYIGTDVSGMSEVGNGANGIVISTAENIIGGSTAQARNVIAGNGGRGVWLDTERAVGNLLQNNFIGIDVSGSMALGNGGDGVSVVHAQGNMIGRAGAGNVISGNDGVGISISDGAADNMVAGNFVGTDSTGTFDLGNGLSGVLLDGAAGNIVGTGGDELGDHAEINTIAFNDDAGVLIVQDTATRNSIRGNSIHSNRKLGIDLGGDGVTLNDPGDADTGPNQVQNFPVFSLAEAGVSTRVVGSLHSTAHMAFTIDVYANVTADPSGYGEGERPLGSFPVNTDGAGIAVFDITLAAATKGGEVITATATDAVGNTSEFSGPETVTFLPVQIDVKPGGAPNTINVGSRGVIPVAILTTPEFDAVSVVASTIVFAGAHATHSAMEDVDADGDLDFILHFRTQDSLLLELYIESIIQDLVDDGEVSHRQTVDVYLTGQTVHDEPFQGSDRVDLVLSNKGMRDLLDELAVLRPRDDVR